MMTQDKWVETHPYLQSLASLHAQVDTANAEISTTSPRFPAWDRYADDFEAGVPLLRSGSAGIDLEPAEKTIPLLVEKLAVSPVPRKLAEQTTALDAELHREIDAPHRALSWLLYDETFASSYPGLLCYLGWTALSRHLGPLVEAFANWRAEERWLRSYCPMCGSSPAMAQLTGRDPGRRRFLSCGRCGTRWWYRRTGCPFCETQNGHRLAVLTIEGESGLRIDHCESCLGYLKTYDGEGSESVLMADWTSIHLDILARDRGLKRFATSLYKL